MSKIGRNDPCPCGSGKKYKKCCINNYVNEPIDKEYSYSDDFIKRNSKNGNRILTNAIILKISIISFLIFQAMRQSTTAWII